jgi:membrane-associated protein
LSTAVAVSGILGNIGYWFGSKRVLSTKKDTLVQEKYLVQSKDFFKHGEELLFCQVLTYIQNFAPIVAGIVTMDKRSSYVLYVVSFLWSFTLISQVIIYMVSYWITIK